MPTPKKKEVKAWAVVWEKEIESADYFIDGCCCTDETRAMAVYETKREAEMMTRYSSTGHSIIPITITYEA